MLDDDPLADYHPGNPSSSGMDDDPDTLLEGPDENGVMPAHLAGDFDTVTGTADDQGSVPWPDGVLADVEDVDYTGDQSFPVEEYGGYADHYPEHAERLAERRNWRDKDRTALAEADLVGTAAKVVDTLRSCVAAMQGRTGGELVDLIVYALTSKQTMGCVDRAVLAVYERIAEVFISEYAEDKSRIVDLTDIPGVESCAAKVQAELTLILARTGRDDLPKVPSATWKALVNYVQRMVSRQKALELIAAIEADETDEACMSLFRTLEPPSSSKSLQNADFSRTAKEWEENDIAAEAEAPGFRISSGFASLDYAFTQKDKYGNDAEPRGSWGPGEFHVLAAPTGNGKSAAARRLIVSAAEDLVVGWGREHDKVLIAITEETPKIVYTVAGLGAGQQFHHLANNVVIANVGASRGRLMHSVWDQVISAYHRSQETGQPIVNCGLPSMIVLDYLGGIVSPGEGADTTAMENTANLILRGFCGWDILGMEQFSGESFAAYAGMSWPEGMENFRPAVLGFAQFRKLSDPLWYDPTQKSCSVDDFVVQNPDGSPGWEVRTGDFRIPTQGEIRGSGVVANHATSILVFHRSRPQRNPKVVDPATGRIRLADWRARWILVKTRNGSDLPFIEMRFDSNPSGLRGQFYDFRAEIAIRKGLLAPTDCYQEEGDPILPHRPIVGVFDGVAY